MKLKTIVPVTLLFLATALLSQAQPGTMLALSRNVIGQLTINSMRPGGCATLVCTTNMVTVSRCFTNCFEKLVCTTNTTTGQIQCTNVLVCNVQCFTNTFPQITCTNEFRNTATMTLNESLVGAFPIDGCDELAGASNLVFQASIYANLRTNDWRGTHFGSFKILSGTNVVAFGGLNGINGAGSHRGLEPCAICNHLEGTLQGQIIQSGPLHGARIQAAYAGNLPNVSCPSANAPQGAIALGVEGVAIVPCFSFFPFEPAPTKPLPASSTTAE